MKSKTPRILPSEITSRDLFLDRRRVLRYAAAGAAFGALGTAGSAAFGATIVAPGAKLAYTRNEALSIKDPPNSFEDVTTYNNFYEFGTDKSEPAAQARNFKPLRLEDRPLDRRRITGLVRSTRSSFGLEDIVEKVGGYWNSACTACVASERWSMVIPWDRLSSSRKLLWCSPSPKPRRRNSSSSPR